ncbi:MAG: hypothetical protein WCJ40_12980, partial [Planctomycetota bacterium]
ERLRNATGRGLASRLILLDVSHGDLEGLLEFDERKRYGSSGIPSRSATILELLNPEPESEKLEASIGESR